MLVVAPHTSFRGPSTHSRSLKTSCEMIVQREKSFLSLPSSNGRKGTKSVSPLSITRPNVSPTWAVKRSVFT